MLKKKEYKNDPGNLGRHSLVSELRHTNCLELYVGTNVTAWCKSLGTRIPSTRWGTGLEHAYIMNFDKLTWVLHTCLCLTCLIRCYKLKKKKKRKKKKRINGLVHDGKLTCTLLIRLR